MSTVADYETAPRRQQWRWTATAAMASYLDAGSIVAGSAVLTLWAKSYDLSSTSISVISAFSSNAISAGIGQRTAGYEDIVIAPVLGGGLTWAQARQETVRGLISSSWQLEAERLRLEVELPPGPDSVLIVPAEDGGTSRMVVEPGRHAVEVDLRGSQGVLPTDGDGGT